MSTIDIGRVGVRGVAGVALATPFFRVYFIKLSKIILKMSPKCLQNVSKMSPNVSIETF